jgi:hypothetical protein
VCTATLRSSCFVLFPSLRAYVFQALATLTHV